LLAPYRSILRQPGAPRLVITAFVARIPVGINALAIVLLVRRGTGSFADAGIVDAGLALGSAFLSPAQGRLVDRFGQTKVLVPSALLSAAALIGLDIGVHHHLSIALLAAFAAVAGGMQPPMGASMRALWAHLIQEPGRRDTAFALEAVLTEVYFVAGPLLTAVIVAVASPSAAVVTSACLTVAGTFAFATSRSSRSWRAVRAKRTIAGPLAGPGFRTLVLSIVPMGLAFGILEVTMPALATRHGDPAAAGILLGAFACGSLIGGLLYGSRAWPGSPAQRYLFLNAMFAAGMAPLILAGSIPVMVVLMAVAGFTLAPVAACIFGLIERVAPPGTTTEAFTWVFTANMTGAAAGAAIAGTLIHSSGIRAALAVPLCGGAASFLLALAGRRALGDSAGAATPAAAGAGAAGAAPTASANATRVAALPPPDAGRLSRALVVPGPLPEGLPARLRAQRFLAASLILAAALLGYRARDGRSDPHRRSRRR
jgi:MFS family permease